MKIKNLILLIAVFIFSINEMQAQSTNDKEFSTIHFVRTKSFVGSALQSYIILPNQQRFALPVGSVVHYKIYSTGEISIAQEFSGSSTAYCNLNVETGKEYYVYLDGFGKFSNVEKSEVQKILDKPKNTANREENLDLPINNKSIEKRNSPKQGTGFLVNNEGYVITNYHVIDGAKEITLKGVKGDFNTPFKLNVVAIDRQLDLALLKIDTKLITFETPPYSFGTSLKVKTASEVYSLGYPMKNAMGSEIKVTKGIVNSKSGFKGSISEFQISASVQPGNSGGPLFDNNGNIMGVVSAKIQSEIIDNVGYAIKSDYLTFFLDQIENIIYKKEDDTSEQIEISNLIEQSSNFIYIIETE